MWSYCQIIIELHFIYFTRQVNEKLILYQWKPDKLGPIRGHRGKNSQLLIFLWMYFSVCYIMVPKLQITAHKCNYFLILKHWRHVPYIYIWWKSLHSADFSTFPSRVVISHGKITVNHPKSHQPFRGILRNLGLVQISVSALIWLFSCLNDCTKDQAAVSDVTEHKCNTLQHKRSSDLKHKRNHCVNLRSKMKRKVWELSSFNDCRRTKRTL